MPCEFVREREVLLEDTVGAAGEKPPSKVALELVDMAFENGAIQERGRVDEPDQRLDAPSLGDRKLERPLVGEARSSQHLLVRVSVDDLFPPRGHPVAGADRVRPPFERVGQDTLPRPIAAPWRLAPEERDTAAFREVGNQSPRNGITVEPVERVTDGDEVEGTLERHLLGRRRDPSDVRDAERLGLPLGELDRLRFLVNRPDLGDIPGQRERDLAGATGKIEQPVCPAKGDAGAQMLEQDRWVRRPEPVVVLPRALEEILAEPGLDDNDLLPAPLGPGTATS